MKRIIEHIQVNIPFPMLYETYLSKFLQERINPEIGCDADALDRFSMLDFKKVAEAIHAQGLHPTLHAPFMDLSPGSSDDKVRAVTKYRFEQVIQLAELFRPKAIVCHTGYDFKRYGFLKDLWLKRSWEMWAWLADSIRNTGAALMLENVYEHHPMECQKLFNGLKDMGIGFCLDVGHTFAFGRADLAEWLNVMGDEIKQLHLHDNHGLLDDHLPMGKGEIDFPMLFDFLKERWSDPPLITLEPHREEDLAPALHYLGEIWPW